MGPNLRTLSSFVHWARNTDFNYNVQFIVSSSFVITDVKEILRIKFKEICSLQYTIAKLHCTTCLIPGDLEKIMFLYMNGEKWILWQTEILSLL